MKFFWFGSAEDVFLKLKNVIIMSEDFCRWCHSNYC